VVAVLAKGCHSSAAAGGTLKMKGQVCFSNLTGFQSWWKKKQGRGKCGIWAWWKMWCVILRIKKSFVIAQVGNNGFCAAEAARGSEGPGFSGCLKLQTSQIAAWWSLLMGIEYAT